MDSPPQNIRKKCDVLVIGGGIIGLSVGIALLESSPALKVIIVEKEDYIGFHASGRNSGVVHAGFYYSPDSLKARFCRSGNTELRKIARNHNIPVREAGKIVVARNDEENSRLDFLFKRGQENGVDLELLDVGHLANFEPLARSFERFIWSPSTAVSDPVAILKAFASDFIGHGGQFHLGKEIALKEVDGEVVVADGSYDAKYIVNAAGAHADRLSRKIGVGLEYAMIPFMGVYRITDKKSLPLKRLVYPVPHPINPFLGVHFTLTMEGKVKIGPTAIPMVGREQYKVSSGFSVSDLQQTIKGIGAIAKGKHHKIGKLIQSEWPKIFESNLVNEAIELVPSAANVSNWSRKPPGIRAQLVDLRSGKLEQDFVIKTFGNSTHILNAVSPGWTSALPFGRWVANLITSRNEV